MTLRALVVGFGSIGGRHISNLFALRPEAQITVLRHSRNVEDKTNPLLRQCRVVHSLEQAMAHRPDIAVIASPAPFHVPVALELAATDVHLLVEKPLSDSTARLDDLLSACDRRNLVLTVGYCLRFRPSLQRLREAIQRGLIGRPLSFRAEVGQYLPDWRPQADLRQTVSARQELGGGAILELSHEIDYACWLFGTARCVVARTGRLSRLEIDVEDTAELIVEFQNGVLGSVHLDMTRRSPKRTCEVIGDEGTLVWDGQTNRVSLFTAKTGTWNDLYSEPSVDRNADFLEELRHFLDCVDGKAQPIVTGIEAARVVKLCVAAKRSAIEGRLVDL